MPSVDFDDDVMTGNRAGKFSHVCKIKAPTHFPTPEDCEPSFFERLAPWLMLLRRRIRPKFDYQARALTVEQKARSQLVETLSNRQDPRELEVLKTLRHAFISGDHEGLNSLPPEQAQIALDIMQELFVNLVLDDHEDDGELIFAESRWLLNRRLQKLACEACLLPSQMNVSSVQCGDLTPVGGGAAADLYCGTLGEDKVGIKYLRSFSAGQPEKIAKKAKKLFFREAILWFNVHHDNILKFQGVCNPRVVNRQDPYGLCMVLEWAENKDIVQHLDQLVEKGLAGDEYLQKVNTWLFQIAQGLACLHIFGIVHGDLRGANILVNAAGIALLADFGLSVIADVGASFTEAHGIACVPWTAPELFDVDQDARPTCQSDIYAFGCTCVELYSNSPPFGEMKVAQVMGHVLAGHHPPRPSTQDHGIHDALWALVKKCWKKKPSKRPVANDIVRKLPKIFPYLIPQVL